MDKSLLIEQLIEFEGLKLKPYKCTANKLTIGIGRNLEVVCKEMKNSKWYSDVGRRAIYLIELMRTGENIAT
jgi:GH24 family phage-related lysozyme (muramidase)